MQPLIDNKYLLEKFEGKGGWTYALMPDISSEKKRGFGWIKVKGTIDGYEIRKFSLAPMGQGKMFLSVNATIRKAIKKEAGDWIHVILYADDEPLIAPDEMISCLEDEPKALTFFNSLSESERKFYIDWIYSAKKEETKIERMVKAIDRLAAGKKLYI